jgi:putative transposase
MEEPHFHRKRPAHCPPIVRHNTATILLVTVCVGDRRKILANSRVQDVLVHCWQQANHWVVGHYLIMPDHLHLFCAPREYDHARVQQWVGYWKRLAGDEMPKLKYAFQRDSWDRQMRDATHYRRKLTYVSQNPVRADLVTEATSWPYQGHLTDLSWISGDRHI